jgi:hypothetical protein
MVLRFRHVAVALSLSLIETSCTPAAPQIKVFRRDHALVIDFPWTLSRWLGLQDRNLCLRHIEVFDAKSVVWRLDYEADKSPCVNVKVPIRMGAPVEGFVASGPLVLHAGRTYGVGLDDLTRVDFVPFTNRPPRNVADWTEYQKWFEAPCGSRWSKCGNPGDGPRI